MRALAFKWQRVVWRCWRDRAVYRGQIYEAALIQLAWRLVIWQPESKLVKKWQAVLGQPKASKGARKKAIVAIARQMAVDLWRWKTQRAEPADFGWEMVGA